MINYFQAHKRAGLLEKEVNSICSKIQQELGNGSITAKEANKLIVNQGDVRAISLATEHCLFYMYYQVHYMPDYFVSIISYLDIVICCDFSMEER